MPTNQEKLNRMCPVFGDKEGIKFGDRLYAIITLLNEVRTKLISSALKTQFDGLVTDLNTQAANFNKLRKMLRNQNLAPAGLTLSAGTKDQVKSVNNINYMINGILYSKNATDPLGAWTVGHTGLGNSEEAFYLICLDASGTLSTVEGAIVAAAAGCVMPEVPADVCAIGALKVVTGAAGTFVPDTTLLDDGDITVSYYDLAMINSGDGAAEDVAASTRVAPSVSSSAVESLD